MTTLQHHNIDVYGMQLHVVTAGSGEPVVLLHGWPQTWYEWRNLIGPLAEKLKSFYQTVDTGSLRKNRTS